MSPIIVAVVIVILALLLARILEGEPRGRNQSRDFNRLHGKYRILYKDGEWSEPMCRDLAEDYASMFGGRVFRKEAFNPTHPHA